jgi:hypothetical protein
MDKIRGRLRSRPLIVVEKLLVYFLVLPWLVLVLVIPVTWLAEHHTSAALSKKQVEE